MQKKNELTRTTADPVGIDRYNEKTMPITQEREPKKRLR
jgi:hypothetical protein